MFHHKDIEEKISSIFDNHSDQNDLKKVEDHITHCQSCRRFKKEVESLSKILKRWMEDTIPKDLERNINSLPKNQKEAITLLEYHKLSYEKVSRIINCHPSKVPHIIYKTRKKLISGNPIAIFWRQNIHIILSGMVILLFVHIGIQIAKNERTVKYIMNIKDKRNSISMILNEAVDTTSNEVISLSSGNSKDDSEQEGLSETKAPIIKTISRFPVDIKIHAINFRKSSDDFIKTSNQPRTRFPLNIKDRSYNLIKQFIESGRLPPKSSVRIEELINSFYYRYPNPKDKDVILYPEVGKCPWNPEHYLLMVGLRTKVKGEPSAILSEAKLQVNFDTNSIGRYQLLGFSYYKCPRGSIMNDLKYGEDLLSNYTVTALYELVPNNLQINLELKDNLSSAKPIISFFLTGRNPDTDKKVEYEQNIQLDDFTREPSKDFLFASSVAEYGLVLKDSSKAGVASLEHLKKIIGQSIENDISGERAEFLKLIKQTESLLNK